MSPQPVPFPPELTPLLEALLQELERAEQKPVDPYWPKWDQIWWKLTFLLETGHIQTLSPGVFARFSELLAAHYLSFFPLTEHELPSGTDPYRHILCHCALGTALQILSAGGRDPWQDWPWLQAWLRRYQLPDGGYNCDEAVYGHSQRSSLVSTLPVLEALLNQPALTASDERLLRQGAESLLRRKLFLSSQGQVIDPLWLTPIFPRFYNYDILRALHFLCRWALKCREPLTHEALAPALNHLKGLADSQALGQQAWHPAQESTLAPHPQSGEWERGQPSRLFPLLQTFLDKHLAPAYLQQEWQNTQAQLNSLANMGLFV